MTGLAGTCNIVLILQILHRPQPFRGETINSRERIRVFGRGGGYVFNPIHCVQPNVPAANLLAMFRAVRDGA